MVKRSLKVLNGRWKLAILFRLFEAPKWRFSELQRDIDGISQKMLGQQLHAMERDGIIERTAFPEVPPRVEYELTERGRGLGPALRALRIWGDHD